MRAKQVAGSPKQKGTVRPSRAITAPADMPTTTFQRHHFHAISERTVARSRQHDLEILEGAELANTTRRQRSGSAPAICTRQSSNVDDTLLEQLNLLASQWFAYTSERPFPAREVQRLRTPPSSPTHIKFPSLRPRTVSATHGSGLAVALLALGIARTHAPVSAGFGDRESEVRDREARESMLSASGVMSRPSMDALGLQSMTAEDLKAAGISGIRDSQSVAHQLITFPENGRASASPGAQSTVSRGSISPSMSPGGGRTGRLWARPKPVLFDMAYQSSATSVQEQHSKLTRSIDGRGLRPGVDASPGEKPAATPEAHDAAAGRTVVAQPGSPDGSNLLDRWSQLRDTVAEAAQLQGNIIEKPPQRRSSGGFKQLAGHPDNFKETGDPSYILKAKDPIECAAFEAMSQCPIMQRFAVEFHGTLATVEEAKSKDQAAPMPADWNVGAPDREPEPEKEHREWIKIRNLLDGLVMPSMMDCKIGQRTYLHNKKNRSKKRPDLAQKMHKIDPTMLTPEELEEGITKERYMRFREEQSSSALLGFRIESMHVADGHSEASGSTFAKYCVPADRDGVVGELRRFLNGRDDVRLGYIKRLRELRSELPKSAFFRTHEIVGSSLLFTYDNEGRSDITMLDFGKTVPCDHELRHDVDYEYPTESREEGYLIGIDSIIELLSEIYFPRKAWSRA